MDPDAIISGSKELLGFILWLKRRVEPCVIFVSWAESRKGEQVSWAIIRTGAMPCPSVRSRF